MTDGGLYVEARQALAAIPTSDERAMLAGLIGETHPFPDTQEESARMDRLVSTLVLRLANQHDCQNRVQARLLGTPGLHKDHCTSRNHRRDRAYADELLAMLGLSGIPADLSDYRAPVAYHSLGRKEARDWGKV